MQTEVTVISIGGTGRGSHDLTRQAILAAGGTIDDKAPEDEKKGPTLYHG